MANALEALRRLQRQEQRRQRAAQTPTRAQERREDERRAPPPPPLPQTQERALDALVVLRSPVDPAAVAADERTALAAAGLVAQLADGRTVDLTPRADGVVFEWPLGAVDADGLPLPYLRNGSAVVPFAAADRWKWWRGGPGPEELTDQLRAAKGEVTGA